MTDKDTSLSLGATQNQRRENPVFISVLGYREEGEWVAHALEMDLIGVGDSWEEAREELVGTIHAHISIARERKDPSLLFRMAPEELLEKYRQAVRAEMRALVDDSRQDENLFRAALRYGLAAGAEWRVCCRRARSHRASIASDIGRLNAM